MKPEEIHFLSYVKTKVLPKHGLSESDVSLTKNDDFFVMQYLLEGKKMEDMLSWYEKASKLHEEISTICYVVTKKKMDNIIVSGDKVKDSENLLNQI